MSLVLISANFILSGLTPDARLLDKAVDKVFKGHFRLKYDCYILKAPHGKLETYKHPQDSVQEKNQFVGSFYLNLLIISA